MNNASINPNRLKGKRAFVLGAAGRDNMGQVIARQMQGEGAKVVVAGRGAEELAQIATELGGGFVLCDLSDPTSIRKAVTEAAAQMGGIDIAVNAAGWGLLKPFLETTEAELEQMTQVSFTGPFILFQSLVAAMEDGGSIIQISSATATIMLNDHAAYMGAKAGGDHLVRCIAHEFGAQGIRCNSISPGMTMTPMTAKRAAIPGLVEAYRKAYPLGRIGTCDDIAEAACWLASDTCFMTGQNLQVNGGLTLRANPTREDIVRSIAEHAQEAAE
ncbi:SDR family oxidoreductase (plasmid) [Novosphingobium resinovorum]|uniref:SDR family oxidoreductase n=1 Tax=Novosphingobium TaxID=165696 RepID=UPI001B3C9AA6|nr:MULTISPECIES: SDR family oxidoreductase [Novosphingobium]MBF7015257.1 SDR family oxidoreductase [Novosphingobium sp. HR1a]WJM29932.1 SDR family oxidoreductase [Novosphingobium resinovorum]